MVDTYRIFDDQDSSPEVPPKVKNLVWRMCQGCLSTRVRLKDKGVQCTIECVKCDTSYEDLAHMICTCPFAMQVWAKDGVTPRFNLGLLLSC